VSRQVQAIRAKRGPNRYLAATRLGAHEKEIRDVRERDEEHDGDRAEQDPQRPAHSAYHDVAQRRDEHAEPRIAHEALTVGARELLWQPTREA
jgi:hypothetical protein